MKILLEVEAPGWNGSTPGEIPVDLEIHGFITRLIESRSGRKPKISLTVIDDNHVVVPADALLRLQKKAGAR